MRSFLCIVLICLLLCGCGENTFERDSEIIENEKSFHVSKISKDESVTSFAEDESRAEQKNEKDDSINGIWVSQFDMSPIYRDGNKQRDENDYRNKVETMMKNLVEDGFDTVFLQVRPNGDSMYESEIYPLSKYVSGTYGGEIEYDAIKIYLDIAKEHNISVHAWINPFRLCRKNELESFGSGIIYEWLREGIGQRIELGEDGIYYLDPSYPEATELIAEGAREILQKYDFDGIHIDDYFYPTEFEFDDNREFLKSGFADKSDFRKANIDRTVKALFEVTHEFDGKVFGVAPAGNIYSLAEGWYADVYKWCSEDGFLDYVMPQLYFGFENASCPFEQILEDWENAIQNENTKLYIGLSAAKCALGTEGIADKYAGENGKYEWRDQKDILKRSYLEIESSSANGFCIFTYSSFYDPLTGESNPLTLEEKSAFCEII